MTDTRRRFNGIGEEFLFEPEGHVDHALHDTDPPTPSPKTTLSFMHLSETIEMWNFETTRIGDQNTDGPFNLR